MSDTLRGVALLLSVLLWSPVAPLLLRSDVTPDRALLLYAAALVVSVVACSVLNGMVRAYSAPEPEDSAQDAAAPEAELASAGVPLRGTQAPLP